MSKLSVFHHWNMGRNCVCGNLNTAVFYVREGRSIVTAASAMEDPHLDFTGVNFVVSFAVVKQHF